MIAKMNLQSYFFIAALFQNVYGMGANEIQNNLKNNRRFLIMINMDEKNKPISRTNYDHLAREERLRSIKLLREHNARMKEITDFMKNHRLTTIYLLEEIRRIKRDGRVKDLLRDMITYLEKPEYNNEKYFILSLFNKIKKEKIRKSYKVFNQKPNDAIINVIRDPFNDGVVN